MSESFSTGTFDCTAEPGGMGLCLQTTFCLCTVVGEINEKGEGCPGGCVGGTLLTVLSCAPCVMVANAPAVSIGQSETAGHALLCSICCGLCYICQVAREVRKGGDGNANQS